MEFINVLFHINSMIGLNFIIKVPTYNKFLYKNQHPIKKLVNFKNPIYTEPFGNTLRVLPKLTASNIIASCSLFENY